MAHSLACDIWCHRGSEASRGTSSDTLTLPEIGSSESVSHDGISRSTTSRTQLQMCALRALARHGWAGVTHIALVRHPRRKAMECHHHSHSHRYRRRREHRERPAPCLCGGVIWVSVSSKGRAWLNDHYECMCKNQRQKTHHRPS